MKKQTLVVAALGLGLATWIGAEGPLGGVGRWTAWAEEATRDPRQALEDARYKEEAERDFEGARAIYLRVTQDATADAAIRADAWVRLGQVEERIGRVDAARTAYERVLADHPSAREPAAAARQGLARLERRAEPSGEPASSAHGDGTPDGPSQGEPEASRAAGPDVDAARAALEKILDERKVTLHFPDVELTLALEFIQDVSGLAVLRASSLDGLTVTMRAREVRLRDALDTMLSSVGLSWTVLHGVLCVGWPEELEALAQLSWPDEAGAELPDAAAAALVERLRALTLSVNFLDGTTPLADALEFVQTVGDFPLALTPAARDIASAAKCTLRASDVRVDRVLKLLLMGPGLTYRVDAGIVTIDAFEPGQARVTAVRWAAAVRRGAGSDLLDRTGAPFSLARVRPDGSHADSTLFTGADASGAIDQLAAWLAHQPIQGYAGPASAVRASGAERSAYRWIDDVLPYGGYHVRVLEVRGPRFLDLVVDRRGRVCAAALGEKP